VHLTFFIFRISLRQSLDSFREKGRGINRCAIDPSLGGLQQKSMQVYLTFFIFRISLRQSLDSFREKGRGINRCAIDPSLGGFNKNQCRCYAPYIFYFQNFAQAKPGLILKIKNAPSGALIFVSGE
jgi:ribosomal protein S14